MHIKPEHLETVILVLTKALDNSRICQKYYRSVRDNDPIYEHLLLLETKVIEDLEGVLYGKEKCNKEAS
jgi:hypothetical protein